MQITSVVYLGMLDHARCEFPQECCGLLAGKDKWISRRIRCTNQLHSRTAFQVPPRELFDGFRAIREEGLQLLGIYHSHPATEAVPSARDAAEFFYPGVSYWIVSLAYAGVTVGCFLWENETFKEVPYTVVDRPRQEIETESKSGLNFW